MMMIFVKTKKQIEGIRKSCQLAARTLKFIEPYIQPGVTTAKLDSLMEEFMRSHKAIPATLGYKGACPGQPPYSKSSCISLNEVVCHGVPNDTVVKEGDIVGVDVTTILDGYFGDTAVTFPVGEVSKEYRHLLEVAKNCLNLGIEQVYPGRLTGEIGYNVHGYATSKGCSVVEQYCGHGTGFFFHEPPQICHVAEKHDGVIMFEGMIFTIEPMINLGEPNVVIDESDRWSVRTADNSASAQFEHTILVTSNGYEILTI